MYNIGMYLLAALIGYALGNISTGIIVGKSTANVDIRQHGSGNAGTTNMLRTLGWLPSVLTLIGDVLKALAAGLIGRAVAGENGAVIGGIFAVVGHNWPAALGFKGGKGIAASLGAILVVDPAMGFIMLGIQIIILAATRYMSVASIFTTTLYMVSTLIFRFGRWDLFALSVAVWGLALYSHKANIIRLKNGTENRLDFSKISLFTGKKK